MLLLSLFTMFASSAFAQRTVTGVVSDDSGELLPGASVVIKGTTRGVITDIDGNYSISVPSTSSVLVFSFVGMETQEVVVGNQTTINVTMISTTIGLDDVVVTALGISREKKSLGYSVGEVDGEDFQRVVQENVLNSLAGRVSGVAISSTGGAGSSVSMVIRGATSLTSDNQPLFVVDGIPMVNTLNNVKEMARDTKADYGNAISDINPEDIENVSILKGPSAAALYGSRAGNGVVLITTKSGKRGKGMGVTITSNTVFESPYKYLEKHNLFANGQRPFTQDNRPPNGMDFYSVPAGDSYWVGPELDKGMMAYQWPFLDENGVPKERELISHPDNWKEFFQTGYTMTNGISVTDATEKINYRLSLSNMQNRGVIPNSDLRRTSLSLNSSIKIHEKVNVSSTINITTSGAGNRPAGNRGANPMQALYEMNPHLDVGEMKDYWEPGKEGLEQRSPHNLVDNGDGTYGKSDIMNNPYFIANEINNEFRRDRVYGNIKVDWQIIPELDMFVRYNHDQFFEKRETKIAPSYTKEPNGFYGLQNLSRREQNADFLFTWKDNYGDFNITASLGGNYLYRFGDDHTSHAKRGGGGLIIPNIYALGNIAPDNLTYSSSYFEKAIYSLYALASVGWKDALFLDITGRNDWSSTLPEENRSYFYPSVSLSWLVSNMFELPDVISLAKLRGGWAKVGNDTSPYQLEPTMDDLGSWGNQPRAGLPGTLLLADLKPEEQKSWEIGTDLAFFDSRLRLDFTYYEAENENQILDVDLSPSSGYTAKKINAGLLSSKGTEFSIGGVPITNADWKWDVNLVYSRNRTKVEELAEGFDHIILWTDAKGGAVTWVGEEIGQIIDRALVRVEDPSSPYDGWPIIDDEGWEDSNSDWQDAEGNRIAPVIGNFNPDFMLGFQTTLTYKSWTLSMNFDWRKGGQFVSQTQRYGESDLHTQRWLDKAHNFSDIDDIPAFLKANQDKYLSPDGEFFVVVGGPTAEYGGFPLTEDGITLNDGVFMPGVQGQYEGEGENRKFVMERENLGDEKTPMNRYQDFYGWSYTRNATFDADFLKLREIAIAYKLPKSFLEKIRCQSGSVSLYSRNIILWTAAKINIDPELAFQPEGGKQGSGIMFKQGIERFNVAPWTIPIGFKLNISF
jgi:TonB-linked SusC/RagA family outer membrane protein